MDTEQANFRLLRNEEIARRISEVKLEGATANRMPYGMTIALMPFHSVGVQKLQQQHVLKSVELFSWSQARTAASEICSS